MADDRELQNGDVARDGLPATLRRSPRRAQRTWLQARDSARRTYGGGDGAPYRVAWAAVKHSFEKVGDRWVAKRRRGPSDPRAESGGPHPVGESFGGVDVNGSTRAELARRARALGVRGTSRMRKAELGRIIARRQDP